MKSFRSLLWSSGMTLKCSWNHIDPKKNVRKKMPSIFKKTQRVVTCLMVGKLQMTHWGHMVRVHGKVNQGSYSLVETLYPTGKKEYLLLWLRIHPIIWLIICTSLTLSVSSGGPRKRGRNDGTNPRTSIIHLSSTNRLVYSCDGRCTASQTKHDDQNIGCTPLLSTSPWKDG